jgi:hypothetical protein
MALRDMMLEWADQEEQECDRFPRRDGNNSKRNGNQCSNRGQHNFNKKRKPEDTVTAVDRTQRGKKPGGQQDSFEKLLHKQCPLHPKAKQSILECISLQKSLN